MHQHQPTPRATCCTWLAAAPQKKTAAAAAKGVHVFCRSPSGLASQRVIKKRIFSCRIRWISQKTVHKNCIRTFLSYMKTSRNPREKLRPQMVPLFPHWSRDSPFPQISNTSRRDPRGLQSGYQEPVFSWKGRTDHPTCTGPMKNM